MVLDGKVLKVDYVVGEVLPGETPEEAAARIKAGLAPYTAEEIAQAANLAPDEVRIRQNGEG
jgi:hypothetical protein